MSPHDLTTTLGSVPDGVAERLDRLRGRLPEIDANQPDGLIGLRSELEALQGETEGEDRQGLASAAEAAVALMTEVWECLAAECPESAHAAASFCVRALEHIASAASNHGDSHDLSWILEESSACWSDYLVLIDPSSTQEIGDGGDPGFDANPNLGSDVDSKATPPAIDATTLFQMLTGTALPPRTSEAGPLASPSRATPGAAAGAAQARAANRPAQEQRPSSGRAGMTSVRASTPAPVAGPRKVVLAVPGSRAWRRPWRSTPNSARRSSRRRSTSLNGLNPWSSA